MAPPKLYTSTGVADRSLRGFLHHIVLKSAGAWKRLSYEDIQEVLALLIEAGMKEADVHSLLMGSIDQDNPLPEESDISKKIVPLIAKPPSNSELVSPSKDLILELVHMIDTGGQPELMEVMPSLIHNADIAIVLINLEYGLNKCPKMSYHEKGVEYACQLSSHYTARDIILKLASTLHAKKSLHQTFRLLIVATHRDCVIGNFEAQIENLNTELHSLLITPFENELILSKAPGQIPFVLNLKNPEDCDIKALNKIRTDIGKQRLGNTFDTPTSFFVFEQDLVQFANNTVKRQILSLDECKQVGTRLKMSGEIVEAALILFHRQNTFLYFRHVLPNHVFVNPQVPLDIINGIVRYRYKMNAGKLETLIRAIFVTQLNQGIITEELLGCDRISSHFEKGFYEVQDAIKLFCHTFTIAPLQSDNQKTATPVDDKQRQYLMMCLMPDIPKHELNDYIPKSSDTVPLVVKFSSGCVPLGCFGSTVACLISKYGWKVITKRDKCLAHNIAHLHDSKVPVTVVLVDFTQYIELHVEPKKTNDSLLEVCSQVHSKVLGAIENVFNIMHLDTDLIKISSAVLCSICDEASEKHFAEFVNHKGKYSLRCGYEYDFPNEKQLFWMGIDAASKDPLKKPTLPLLQRFPTQSDGVIKIIERIGTKHHELGIRLLDDKDGMITAKIEAQYKHDPPSRTTEAILQEWLRGTGRTPQSWDTLITVLREIELNTLAQDIEDNLLNTQVQTQKKQTSHQSQKPSPQLMIKEEQTLDQSQKPSPELKEEQTPDQSQKPSPELKEEQTPDQSQKPSPEPKEEQTPDQSQKPSPELKEEQTPDQSQKPSPEPKEEQTPDQSQKSSAATHQTERQNQYKSEPTKEQYRTTWKQVLFWSICVVLLAVLLNLLLHAGSHLFAY